MPGNEAADKLYNFFEKENLSLGQRNSQVASARWPVVSNNLWVENQRQIGPALSSDTRNHTVQHSDSDGGSVQQTPQTLFRTTNPPSSTLRPEFGKNQFGNQELNSNGFIQAHQSLPYRYNHTQSHIVKDASEHLKLTSSASSVIEQRGNAPEHIPALARASGRLETVEAPKAFNLLDRQHHPMNNQQPGMSQPRPRQQPGLGDMPLWQQQYMFKQLQELQRQKQIQQLEQGGRFQNQINHLTALTKQSANDQLPAIVNGMPIPGSANYAWQNEPSGSDSRIPNNSQMFMVGNTNYAHRGGYSAGQGIPDGLLINEQGQVLRSMGLVPQQLDQPVYSAQNDSTRGAFNHYSQQQGTPPDRANILNEGNGNLTKPIIQSMPLTNSLQGGQSSLYSNQFHDGASVSRQGFQGKNIFGHVPFQGMSSGVHPGNSMHVNSLVGNTSQREFHGREQQAGWSGNLQERAAGQFQSSQGVVSLDPTEKKILFSTDDNVWNTPSDKGASAGAGDYDNPLERADDLPFPSMQSGTWSALMQSAVAEASSSDTGLQDEWSGLSFQKELSAVDQPIALGDSTRLKTDFSDSNLQGASPLISKSAPLFDDGNMSQGRRAPNVNQSGTRNMYDLSERMQQDPPFGSNQQSLNDSGKWLDRSPQQKTSIHGDHQAQQFMDSRNAWARQIHSEGADRAMNVAGDAHKTQGPWVHQQGASSPNINNQHGNNTAGWNHINTLSSRGAGASNINERGNSEQRFQRGDLKMGMNTETDRGGGLMMANSYPNFTDGGGSRMFKGDATYANNSRIPNSGTTNSVQDANQQVLNSHHLNYQKHFVSSPVNRRDDAVGYNQNLFGAQVLEASIYNSDRGSGEAFDRKQEKNFQREFSNDSYSSNQSQPTVPGGTFRDNSWLSTSDSRPIASASQKSSTQAAPQQIYQGSKGHEREYFGQPEFNSNSSNAMEKEHIPDFQGTERGSASSDGSAGTFSQNRKPVKTCQNMLELFHSVDQSVEHVTQARISSADQNTSPVISEAEGSDASVARQWQSQSTASQGFGLRLGPPSQRPSVANHALNSQNSLPINSLNSRQVDSKVEERGQRWVSPASSVQSLPHEITQREHWDNSPNNSGQTSNETSQLNAEPSGPGAFTSSISHSRIQLQPQPVSRIIEKATSDPPLNLSSDRLNSHFRQTHVPYGEVIGDQAVQTSLSGTTSRNSFVASPSEDTSRPESSSWSQVRVSGQQFPVLESVPVSRPSAMSGKPQQVDFSTMLHHVLANASQQQLNSGQTNKAPPNFLKPANLSNSNLERVSFPAQSLEDGGTSKGGNSSGLAGPTDSQGGAYGQEQTGRENSWKQITGGKVDLTPQRAGASLRQESMMKHPPETRFRSSDSLPAHPHQQEIDRGRYGRDTTVSQRENSSFHNLTTSARDIEAFGRNLRPGNQNYSLLHQMQAMRSVENDLDTRGGKRLKGANSDADSQQIANRAGHHMIDGCNVDARDPLHSGQNSAVQHTSYSSADNRMLSFSSERREDQNASMAPQTVHGVPSHDVVTYGQNEPHNRSSQLNVSSNRGEMPQINPKMAPTWFGRYGTFRSDEILPVPNAVKLIPQQFPFGEGSEGLLTNSSKEQINTVDASQSKFINMVPTENLISLPPVPSESGDQLLSVPSPKKRKPEKSMLLPWHKEIVGSSKRLETISMSEQDWAQAANRLVEKMEDEAELADDALPIIRPRRRLIYTTQLMQHLLCPAPAEILSAKATSDYETVTYSVAKAALGEACSLVSSSESDVQSPIVNENGESGKLEISGRARGQRFARVVEDFVGRAKKLESDLLRLDKKPSVIDIRVECQDLERFSVINRFAKFHGRGQADAAETSSSSSAAAASQKTIPQRYVTAHPMPRNLPGGVHCLSL